jgi:hypothetical protein
MQPIIDEQESLIPSNEQDDDRWRYALPGRDPVTKSSHTLEDHNQQLREFETAGKARLKK